jgi:hypothetical protein
MRGAAVVGNNAVMTGEGQVVQLDVRIEDVLCPMASTDPPLSSDWAGRRYRLGNRWYVFCRSS